ncbi:amino acid adenylation domain-containing protein [Flavobacterium selenitireducens]|uniref:amino acid adenylation domain-containing protein n=1 Tax=Flavobacterium selenitireducens TaxID=2722704 RepID=UPI00168B792B|nr:amino acid adenylation domain-containing protein [Flavobacterium selenitireducens]MBD3581387.1 amino acid adenylation domain-containing protein [Flavobacterium selenitireducens]
MFRKHILDPLRDCLVSSAAQNAFCIGETFYSYSDFGKKISSIRSVLKDQQTGNRIGIVANDDLETYASIFAVWFEGLAYVPLHPMQPLERNLDIAGQAGITLLLNSDGKAEYVHQVTTSDLPEAASDFDFTEVSDDSLAYILFTSGSTGKPKGVAITRGNVGAFMAAFWKAGFAIDASDRCLQCFDLTFDVSVQSFLVPLTRGACVYTIPHDQIKYSYVFGLLDDHQLTFGAMAPSMVRFLRPYFDEIDVPSMRYVIMTAEASPLDLISEWAKCVPNAEIFDFYGPTEATIYCTYYKMPRIASAKELNGMLSIGKPMDGITAVMLGEDGEILPEGEKGEMCIAGPQLTPGYWNNPEKNAEAFLNLELNGETRRFYKTGDVCYFDADGDIMYYGRLDYQVKIQGYRIELGEIEFHCREFLGGHNAVVIPVENAMRNTELVLFVESAADVNETLSSYLKSKLPSYMVPAKVVLQDVFPINTNGKVDRNKLKAMLN